MSKFVNLESKRSKHVLQIVNESPVENVENEKCGGKKDARSSIDPVCDLLGCHCGPTLFHIWIGRCAIRMAHLKCCGAGRWFHIHTDVIAIFLHQIIHTLRCCYRWYLVIIRKRLKHKN